MAQAQQAPGGLRAAGLTNLGEEHWNQGVAALYEAAVRRGEASISADGPLVCLTGQHTGRSPNDKFLVREPSSAEHVWWGSVNRPLDQTRFDLLHEHVARYLEGRETWVRDAYAGADPAYRLPIRVVTEHAWHSLFARHMFIGERDPQRLAAHVPEFTVIDAPGCKADPARHGTRSETFIVVNFAKRLVLIGGTTYAGEIKKSIFTVMNYLLPLRQVLPMHCSANVGPDGDVALFFGLSGTGKTTLSSDPGRGPDRRRRARLVGPRRLQLRGRLLRQGDQALGRGRAGDLRDDAALRHGARERGDGAGHAGARPRQRPADREHAGRLSARLHRQRRRVGAGRPPAQRDHADGRRLRRAAAHRAADARRRHVPLPVRLHGQGRRHREGRDRAEGDLQHVLRRAVHGVAPGRLRAPAGRAHRPSRRARAGW